jgi:Saxitoxin biosynthesis operon protein SxtJ
VRSSSTDRNLVSFALIMSVALVVIAEWRWHRGSALWVPSVLAAIAVLFLLAAAIAPTTLRPVYRVWMRVGEGLAWINTRILLTLVFFLAVMPIGILMRLFGRSPLDHQGTGDSYWIDTDPHAYGDRHVEKQF